MRMLSSSENCARTPPAARDVDPDASSSRSSSSTSAHAGLGEVEGDARAHDAAADDDDLAPRGAAPPARYAALTAGITSRPYASSVDSCSPVMR